jgi:hypothetical protein
MKGIFLSEKGILFNVKGLHIAGFFVILSLVFSVPACREKKKPDLVDFEHIETDGSVNDEYLFQDLIEKQKERENRYRREEF